MDLMIVAVLAIALLSPLAASDESDSSEGTSGNEVLRKAGKKLVLKPLTSDNIQAFFEYFEHGTDEKPEALVGKLGKGNIHRRFMNPYGFRHAPETKKHGAPKSVPKVVAKEDVALKSLNYHKVVNVNK